MPRNLVQLLVAQAEARPNLRIGTPDMQCDLSDAIRRAAGGAGEIAKQVGPDDRAALVASTSTSFLIVWMACLMAGVPVALINPTYPEDLLAAMIDDLDPKLIFTDLPRTSFARDRAVVSVNAVATWANARPETTSGVEAGEGRIASYMHTSGTSGIPKFCAQSHGYFLRLGRAMAGALELTAGDRLLAPLPLFHINPMGYGVLGALTAGADVLTVKRFSASRFWSTVVAYQITVLTLHGPPVEILKRGTRPEDSRGHRVRTMFYADAEFMSRFGVEEAVSGYGSTEAAGVSHLHRWSSGVSVPPTASRYGGKPRPDIGHEVDADGQIRVRELEPNTLFSGYVTANGLDRARDSKDWFATGDLGVLDHHGGLQFFERASESIRVKGEFVPIPFVEAQFNSIGDLDDFAIWKKPGQLVDEEIILFVVAENVPFDRIRQVAGELPPFMRPSYIAQILRIPRDTAAGKVQRRLLAEEKILSWVALT